MTSVFPIRGDDDSVIETFGQPWGITSSSARAAYANQQKFFKALDRHDATQEGPVDFGNSNRKSDPYNDRLTSEMGRFPDLFRNKSPTVVMEAAFFLLQQGLLDVPDVGGVNVKQARAFLWNAAWLQETHPWWSLLCVGVIPILISWCTCYQPKYITRAINLRANLGGDQSICIYIYIT